MELCWKSIKIELELYVLESSFEEMDSQIWFYFKKMKGNVSMFHLTISSKQDRHIEMFSFLLFLHPTRIKLFVKKPPGIYCGKLKVNFSCFKHSKINMVDYVITYS